MMKKPKKELLIGLAVSLVLGIIIGYMIGMSQAYSTCIHIASRLLDIDFKPSMIVDFPKLVRYIR